MMPVTYPRRCLNDLFGYCSENREGKLINSTDGKVTMTIVTGECKENYLACKSYVTNTVANPYRKELENAKLETKVIPPQNTPKEKKPRKVKSLTS